VKQVLRQSFLLALIALLPAIGSSAFHLTQPGWDPSALQPGEILLSSVVAFNQPVLWVDARSQGQYEKDHVPQAVLLNEDDWERQFSAVVQRWQTGQPVVVYCDSQECQASRSVAKRLRESGIAPVYVLKGGWQAWLDRKR